MIKGFTQGPFTGRHAAAIFVGFFGVVIAVNFTMARLASSTFGGVVVENSYVASQKYNGWLEAAREQERLGWTAQVARRADGRLAVTMAGTGDLPLTLEATARHPLGRQPDQALSFAADGAGGFVSREALPAGRWRLRLAVDSRAHTWRHELDVL